VRGERTDDLVGEIGVPPTDAHNHLARSRLHEVREGQLFTTLRQDRAVLEDQVRLGTFKSSAAISSKRAFTSSAADRTAGESPNTVLLPPLTRLYGVVPVSAFSTLIRSSGTPNSSATTMAITVLVPVPRSAGADVEVDAAIGIEPDYGSGGRAKLLAEHAAGDAHASHPGTVSLGPAARLLPTEHARALGEAFAQAGGGVRLVSSWQMVEMFLRRSSTGSMPSFSARASIICSSAQLPCG